MVTYIIIALVVIVLVYLFLSMLFRTVVATNEVHTIQRRSMTLSYGKDSENGNVYINWPAWLPIIWIERIILPVSIFPINLNNYEAYDSDKVPFVVDIAAFFRIEESNKAAQRISSFTELEEQLKNVLQWVIRRVLAAKNVYEILEGREEFSELFTKEVNDQLKEWWVTTTKNVELMNIEDSNDSRVITNIQEMKTSEIERKNRVVLAENEKIARLKEIETKREADVKQEQADRLVWEQKAEKIKLIWVAEEISAQEIAEAKKLTTTKEMDVKKIEEIKRAEINKGVAIVKAEEEKQTDIVKAEWEKQQTITIAEGNLTEKEKEAKWIEAIGIANALAEKEMQLAPVHAQITLAEKIATLPDYIKYLLWVKGLEVEEIIGTAKAKALESGELKVIANTGSANEGVNNLMDIFSTKWGNSIGSMLENLKQTDAGKALVEKFIWWNNATNEESKQKDNTEKVISKDKKITPDDNTIDSDIIEKINKHIK